MSWNKFFFIFTVWEIEIFYKHKYLHLFQFPMLFLWKLNFMSVIYSFFYMCIYFIIILAEWGLFIFIHRNAKKKKK